MLSRTTTVRAARGLAAGLALFALAAPAQARPLEPEAPYPAAAPTTTRVSPAEADNAFAASHPASAPRVVVVHGTGFDWTDAGVGAAASGGIIVLLGAGLIVSTRSRRRGQTAQIAH